MLDVILEKILDLLLEKILKIVGNNSTIFVFLFLVCSSIYLIRRLLLLARFEPEQVEYRVDSVFFFGLLGLILGCYLEIFQDLNIVIYLFVFVWLLLFLVSLYDFIGDFILGISPRNLNRTLYHIITTILTIVVLFCVFIFI